ncbi:MAG: hypothetical protein JXA30_12085 [Deltaproteobacteria bacterium]|nr:hypothetical protein [Deltaproteobacteria bacterium]
MSNPRRNCGNTVILNSSESERETITDIIAVMENGSGAREISFLSNHSASRSKPETGGRILDAISITTPGES